MPHKLRINLLADKAHGIAQSILGLLPIGLWADPEVDASPNPGIETLTLTVSRYPSRANQSYSLNAEFTEPKTIIDILARKFIGKIKTDSRSEDTVIRDLISARASIEIDEIFIEVEEWNPANGTSISTGPSGPNPSPPPPPPSSDDDFFLIDTPLLGIDFEHGIFDVNHQGTKLKVKLETELLSEPYPNIPIRCLTKSARNVAGKITGYCDKEQTEKVLKTIREYYRS